MSRPLHLLQLREKRKHHLLEAEVSYIYLSYSSFMGTFCMSGWCKKVKKFSFLRVIEQLVGVGIEMVSWRTATRLLYILARVWINFLSWSFAVRFAVNIKKEKYVHTCILTYIHMYIPTTHLHMHVRAHTHYMRYVNSNLFVVLVCIWLSKHPGRDMLNSTAEWASAYFRCRYSAA